MIFLRNSSPVIGDENMPKVPSVAPAWPSADVVAQQSVRVIVLKPARTVVSRRLALGDLRTFLVGRAHRRLDAAVREEAAEHDRLNFLLHERRF